MSRCVFQLRPILRPRREKVAEPLQSMSAEDQKAFRMYGKVPQKSVLSKINKVRLRFNTLQRPPPTCHAVQAVRDAPPSQSVGSPARCARFVFKLLTRRRNASTSIPETT